MSTFQKYGGFSAVSRIIMTFYDLVLDDEEVGHHFDDTDMPRLIDHQTKFISALMGGPEGIGDERLALVHRKYQITHEEFDVVSGLLGDALRAHGMSEPDVSEVLNAFNAKRPLIVQDRAP